MFPEKILVQSNYRVIEFVDKNGDSEFQIREVLLEKGIPSAFWNEPATVLGETPDEIAECVERMRIALDFPPIKASEFR